MSLRDITRCCSKCRASCYNEFKQIVNLKKSGLIIYDYNNLEDVIRYPKYKNIPSIVLHNIGKKELKKIDYVIELCQYKTKCYHCQRVIHRIRSLLDDINVIRKNEVLAVCEHCKRSNFKHKCSRCEYLLERFISCTVNRHESIQDDYRAWWLTVKNTLLTILDVKKTCPHRVCFVQNSDMELKKLINLLRSPSPTVRPCIDTFPNTDVQTSVPINDETKQLLLKVIDDMSIENVPSFLSKVSSISEASTCMCRYFDDKRKADSMPPKLSLEMPIIKENIREREIKNFKYNSSEPVKEVPTRGIKNIKEHVMSRNTQSSENKKELTDPPKKSNEKIKEQDKDIQFKEEVGANVPVKSSKKQIVDSKNKQDPEYKLMLQLIKEHQKEVKSKGRTKSALQLLKKIPDIKGLPELPVRQHRPLKSADEVSEGSGSTIVCTPREFLPPLMIRGTRTVPLEQNLNTTIPVSKETIFFKKKFNCNLPVSLPPKKNSAGALLTDERYKVDKGITKYALSEKSFIDKGWTKLPTTKIMRRMNIYKMEPTNPQFDWFKNHSHKREFFYDSGEILAVLNENGCGGKWFYKNGAVALDFHNSQDLYDQPRYIIYGYSNNDENKLKSLKNPLTILACFDYLGNGVVYDHTGKPRLKYNQSEGIIIDKKIGPSSKWKWHTLNDPPVLQNVYIDNDVKSDALVQKLLKHDDYKDYVKQEPPKCIDEQMIAIELDNFVKEKATKIMQKFKPFKIQMKAVKINENFSLRIIDQTNIYILFRSGHIRLKLNIGMHLKSDEIIDTVTSEVYEVSTPYDFALTKTKSLSDIQEVLNNMQTFYKLRHR